MSAHVLAVTGGKGGVGKSTTTINLAVSLRMDGYSVAVIDADIEMPNLVEMLGIDAEITIHDVLGGTADTDDALVEIGDGFAAVPGDHSLSGFASVEPAQLQAVVSRLEEDYEYVLLDTGAGLSYDDVLPISLADEILIVSSPDPAAVQNARRTLAFIRRLNRSITGVVITKADGPVDDAIVDQFDAELLAVVPEDKVVRQSTAAGEPLEIYAPDSDAAQAYRRLEANLTDGELPPQRTEPSTPGSADAPDPTVDERREAPEDEPDADDDGDGGAEKATEAAEPGLITRFVKRVTP